MAPISMIAAPAPGPKQAFPQHSKCMVVLIQRSAKRSIFMTGSGGRFKCGRGWRLPERRLRPRPLRSNSGVRFELASMSSRCCSSRPAVDPHFVLLSRPATSSLSLVQRWVQPARRRQLAAQFTQCAHNKTIARGLCAQLGHSTSPRIQSASTKPSRCPNSPALNLCQHFQPHADFIGDKATMRTVFVHSCQKVV